MSISVVIPAYNAEAFLAETIRSVLAQTQPVDEILVIDDGSSDGTAAVAEQFGAPVRVFRRANARQAASRNFGVAEAMSEWVAFVDADDLWEPNKLARQMEELGRRSGAELCYTARIEFTAQATEQGEVRTFGTLIPVPEPEGIRKALFRNTTFLPSSALIRRETFLAAGGFDTRYKIVEDWDLWLRMLHSGVKFAGCQEPLLLYRVHPNSASHNAIPALLEAKEIYRTRVLPHLPRVTRWMAHQKSQSGQEGAAAYVLRKVGDRRHLGMMARSVARFPFNEPHRYKVLAHMVVSRLLGRG